MCEVSFFTLCVMLNSCVMLSCARTHVSWWIHVPSWNWWCLPCNGSEQCNMDKRNRQASILVWISSITLTFVHMKCYASNSSFQLTYEQRQWMTLISLHTISSMILLVSLSAICPSRRMSEVTGVPPYGLCPNARPSTLPLSSDQYNESAAAASTPPLLCPRSNTCLPDHQ